jgi:hypothetical protein
MTVSRVTARLIATIVLLLTAAGCSSSGPLRSQPGGQAASPSPVTPVGSVSNALPECSTAAQAAPKLPAAATAMTTLVPGDAAAPGPFGVAVVAAGNWGFATSLPVASTAASPAASQADDSGLGVLRMEPGHAPVLVHTIAVPGAAGAALTKNGRLLLVAGGSGAAVVSVQAAEQGGRHAVLGTLVAPGSATADEAIEVAITPDGRYAFVSLETADWIAVFNLARALDHGFRAAGVYVGSIPTQVAPVGLAVSPDGHWLYATSEVDNITTQVGSLSVISVARAESDPAKSLVARVPAGCNPVRVITSADGSVVWVAVRGSDALLAFSAARLRTEPSQALLADIKVGKAPVGLALARAGTLIVVADSNRFAPLLPGSNLAIVNVADALEGRPALLGYLLAGQFPRDVAASANGGLLLVANYDSGQVEAVNAAVLP